MEKLTKEQAALSVNNIRNIQMDDERAHAEEDKLRAHFIDSISQGFYSLEEVIDIASIIQETSELKFARWCA